MRYVVVMVALLLVVVIALEIHHDTERKNALDKARVGREAMLRDALEEAAFRIGIEVAFGCIVERQRAGDGEYCAIRKASSFKDAMILYRQKFPAEATR